MVLIESTGFLNIVFLTCDGVAESGAVQRTAVPRRGTTFERPMALLTTVVAVAPRSYAGT